MRANGGVSVNIFPRSVGNGLHSYDGAIRRGSDHDGQRKNIVFSPPTDDVVFCRR